MQIFLIFFKLYMVGLLLGLFYKNCVLLLNIFWDLIMKYLLQYSNLQSEVYGRRLVFISSIEFENQQFLNVLLKILIVLEREFVGVLILVKFLIIWFRLRFSGGIGIVMVLMEVVYLFQSCVMCEGEGGQVCVCVVFFGVFFFNMCFLWNYVEFRFLVVFYLQMVVLVMSDILIKMYLGRCFVVLCCCYCFFCFFVVRRLLFLVVIYNGINLFVGVVRNYVVSYGSWS